jgi:hypothetical protein
MPCCVGNMKLTKDQNTQWQSLDNYERWTQYLLSLIMSKGVYKYLFKDENILSPCNNIIIAKKG